MVLAAKKTLNSVWQPLARHTTQTFPAGERDGPRGWGYLILALSSPASSGSVTP